jgi:membrane protein implicated in regulation of membrane protease activity
MKAILQRVIIFFAISLVLTNAVWPFSDKRKEKKAARVRGEGQRTGRPQM